MVTRFLVPARDCGAIDATRIAATGARLLDVGRLEDDGTVTVSVHVDDHPTHQRVGEVFGTLRSTGA